MTDSLRTVFTPEVLARLRAVSNPSTFLKIRLAVLEASGEEGGNRHRCLPLRRLKQIKAAWECYLDAAIGRRLLDPDLCARLTSEDDNNFRGSMAECMTAWYLAGPLGLDFSTRPPGKPGRHLEFAIKTEISPIHVEVKAPFVPLPSEGFYWGDDSDVLEAALANANKQFDSRNTNLLVIAPELRIPLFDHRYPLVRAFIGDQFIVQPIDRHTGGPAGPARNEFRAVGRFTRYDTKRASEGGTAYRYTRVSAVLVIEQRPGANMIEHGVLLLHNPNAEHPLRDDIWKEIPQCKTFGDAMGWSDGFPMLY